MLPFRYFRLQTELIFGTKKISYFENFPLQVKNEAPMPPALPITEMGIWKSIKSRCLPINFT